ncbi:MAG TPA: tetratricopeptide repeat protein [Opitutaceae bacterium]|nr:tetratricopeptide repeat protein [Opitutaceae bacterium]
MSTGPGSGAVRGGIVAVALGCAALAAWSNSFGVPFLLDDGPAILLNPSIRRLSALADVLRPELDGGVTAAGRPLVNLSLALNHAAGGLAPAGYHAFNLAVHLAAALALFGLAGRTVGLPPVPASGHRPDPARRPDPGSPGADMAWAAALAALWMLHPLQTAAVTYIVQRAEALAGLWVLLTLHAFARAAGAARPRRWLAVSVLAALAGMASKETAAVGPVLVLLYDRTFVAGSFAGAWRARRGYYVALAGTWALLAFLVAATGGRGGTAGFGAGLSVGEYFLTQCAAVVHYLRLAAWPSPLVFDYGTATVGLDEAWWRLLLLAGLGFATARALVRRSPWGFVGAWFFLTLAPSSSIVPVASQTMAEHRMYLALAAPVAAVALGLRAWLGSRAPWALGALALAAGAATFARNSDYATARRIWSDTVAKRPGNARAHHNLALAELADGRPEAAERHLRDALARAPRSPESLYNLALVLTRLGRPAEAIARYRESLALDPAQAAAHNNLGNLLFAAGRGEEAGRHFAEAVRLQPEFAGARNSYGNWLLEAGRPAEALAQFGEAFRQEPGSAEYRFNAGNACAALGRFEEAAGHFREAARIDPAHAEARNNLGNVLLELGRLPEALAAFEAALRLRADYFEPRRTLALLYLLHLNRPAEARAHLEVLARARPGDREIAEALARAAGR